jgi:NAD(P)H dehydrogenase (quinone)
MQILVLYYSRSGNTKLLAEAVAEGARNVTGVSVVLRTTEEVLKSDFIDSQGIIIGSPVYFGTMAAEIKKVIDDFVSIRKKMEGKVGAAFATSADTSGGKETTILSILQAMLIYGMVVCGDPLKTGGHYGTASAGKPDKTTLQKGKELGKRVAELVNKIGSVYQLVHNKYK